MPKRNNRLFLAPLVNPAILYDTPLIIDPYFRPYRDNSYIHDDLRRFEMR